MTIPDNAKEMILFAFEQRGIRPVHVEANLIVFDVQFESGLSLGAVITAAHRKTFFRTKLVIALGVLNSDMKPKAEFTQYTNLPTQLHDIQFGIGCATTLLAMVRTVADGLNGGHCITRGWLGQAKS